MLDVVVILRRCLYLCSLHSYEVRWHSTEADHVIPELRTSPVQTHEVSDTALFHNEKHMRLMDNQFFLCIPLLLVY